MSYYISHFDISTLLVPINDNNTNTDRYLVNWGIGEWGNEGAWSFQVRPMSILQYQCLSLTHLSELIDIEYYQHPILSQSWCHYWRHEVNLIDYLWLGWVERSHWWFPFLFHYPCTWTVIFRQCLDPTFAQVVYVLLRRSKNKLNTQRNTVQPHIRIQLPIFTAGISQRIRAYVPVPGNPAGWIGASRPCAKSTHHTSASVHEPSRSEGSRCGGIPLTVHRKFWGGRGHPIS